VDFILDRLRRRSDELWGELTTKCSLPGARTVNGVLAVADLNLSSQRARQDRAKYLADRARAEELDWAGLLEEFVQRVLAADRVGEEARSLSRISLQVTGEFEQQALQRIEIFSPQGVAAGKPGEQLVDWTQRVHQVIVHAPALRGHQAELGNLRQQTLDGGFTIEFLAPPHGGKIAPLDELPAGKTQLLHGGSALPGFAPGQTRQRAPQTGRRFAQLLLEPLIESAIEQPRRPVGELKRPPGDAAPPDTGG
jgi:hypothetical protein